MGIGIQKAMLLGAIMKVDRGREARCTARVFHIGLR